MFLDNMKQCEFKSLKQGQENWIWSSLQHDHGCKIINAFAMPLYLPGTHITWSTLSLATFDVARTLSIAERLCWNKLKQRDSNRAL